MSIYLYLSLFPYLSLSVFPEAVVLIGVLGDCTLSFFVSFKSLSRFLLLFFSLFLLSLLVYEKKIDKKQKNSDVKKIDSTTILIISYQPKRKSERQFLHKTEERRVSFVFFPPRRKEPSKVLRSNLNRRTSSNDLLPISIHSLASIFSLSIFNRAFITMFSYFSYHLSILHNFAFLFFIYLPSPLLFFFLSTLRFSLLHLSPYSSSSFFQHLLFLSSFAESFFLSWKTLSSLLSRLNNDAQVPSRRFATQKAQLE